MKAGCQAASVKKPRNREKRKTILRRLMRRFIFFFAVHIDKSTVKIRAIRLKKSAQRLRKMKDTP